MSESPPAYSGLRAWPPAEPGSIRRPYLRVVRQVVHKLLGPISRREGDKRLLPLQKFAEVGADF